MKRNISIFIIFLILLLIYLLYQQCQGRKPVVLSEKKSEKILEKPAPAPPEKQPKPVESTPLKEEVKPVKKPVPAIPRNYTIEAEKKVAKPAEAIEEKKEIIPSEKNEVLPSAVVAEKLISPSVVPLPTEEIEKVEDKEEVMPPVEPNGRIALLPFDNFSDNQDALREVMPLIASRLDSKGLKVVSENKIMAFFCKERMRNISFISKEQSRKVGNILHVGTIMVGAVTSYKPEENPKFGISARLIDTSTGKIIWADYASETGNDFTKLFGLGTITSIDELIPKVLDQLLTSFSIEPLQDDSESKYRVAVLPFKNISQYDDAGIIVTYLFLTELFKHDLFEPVEYGDVWKVIMDSRIRIKGELSHQNIETLSQSLGAGAFLLGTVENYSEGIDGSSPPDITISARLLDARNNKILWFNSLQLKGDDKIKVLDWGKMRAADKVAYSAVSELVENMETARWH